MADMNQFRYPGSTLSTGRAALPASLSLHPLSTFSFPHGEHHLHFNLIGTTSFFSGQGISLSPPLWTAARAVSHLFYSRHYLFFFFSRQQRSCLIVRSLLPLSSAPSASTIGANFRALYFSSDRQREAAGETHPAPLPVRPSVRPS